MYIRRVTRKNKDGTTVAYLQLAHNEWDPKAKYAKAKVIYSFGREDEVDRAVLERLAKSARCIIAWKTAFVRMRCSVGWLSCWFTS
ncbi:hypothetical protein B4110_3719 [Parageobacillus toebii]|uniref:Uncharacterized protein n=1 Tax=Parageobacillus toebii TaxID=153151 RepID=A0A150MVU2_9BACL|nr:hypothetical protein [Parageobacillus toebii]KYD28519.1 hypothetical protein B4110_3719 [Parageobacillus toebii]QSB49676.1 hypothetical protein JTI59_05340 [Parageobacillus toebii]